MRGNTFTALTTTILLLTAVFTATALADTDTGLSSGDAWAVLVQSNSASTPITGRRNLTSTISANMPLSAAISLPMYIPLVVRHHPPPPPTPSLAVYRLQAEQADLDWLATDPYRDETVPATFIYRRRWNVDIRYRGDTSRLMPKKCWKVFFPGSDLFQRQEELNLNADYVDQTLLRSYLGYDLFNRAGVPAPRAGYGSLYLNGGYYGLMSQAEQIDERFLHRQGIEMHGNLYKPWYGNLSTLDYIQDPEERAWWYNYHYPKKTNRESNGRDVVVFIETINYTSDAQFPETIAGILDVNGWLDWYAVNILIGNFEMMEKNYYIYHDFSTDQWLILPWDVDLAMGHNAKAGGGGYGHLLDEEISWDNPIDSGTQESKKVDGKWNVLIDRMMDVPEFRFFHCRRLTELMADQFSPGKMFPRIDAAYKTIRPWALDDTRRWRPEGFRFADGPGELETYIVKRIQFLKGQMPIFCPVLDVPLTINELMIGETESWIELHNSSTTLTWNVGGMYMTDVLSQPTQWRIPDDTRIPPGQTILIWADGEEEAGPLHANFSLSSDGGQIGLFDRDIFSNTAIATLTYTAPLTGTAYGRLPDGSGPWQALTLPTPGWLNQGRPPIISGTAHAPTWPTASDDLVFTTNITDEGTVVATLRYRTFAPGARPPESYQAVSMLPTGGGATWQATLPARPSGTWLEYYVEAEDDVGMISVDRPGWPQGNYRIIVGWQRLPLTINELMALNTHTLEDEAGEADDWIELYNAGPVDLDVGGMYLSDNIDSDTKFVIPAGTIVPAGGHLVLWADGDGTNGHLNFRLSGAGEYVGLFDSQAHYYAPIDAVYFDPQTPDVSWGRFRDGHTTWYTMTHPTPGQPNRLHPPQFSRVTRVPLWPIAGESVTVTAAITAGTPVVSATLWYDVGSGFEPLTMTAKGPLWHSKLTPLAAGTPVSYYLEAVDSVGQHTLHPPDAPTFTYRYVVSYTPPAVLINEFLADNNSANPDEWGEYDDWLELFNSSEVTVTLDGMYLTDDLTEPTEWQFPPGTTIPPYGYLLIWCDGDTGQGPRHADFRLNRDSEQIGLFDDRIPVDWIIYGPQLEDISYGRQPDGGDTWNSLNPPTPGVSNGK